MMMNIRNIDEMRQVRDQGFAWVLALRVDGHAPKGTVVSRHRKRASAEDAWERLDDRYGLYEITKLLDGELAKECKQ